MSTTIQEKELSQAEHIRYLREKAGKTQKELARMIGVHHRTIANYEGGRTVPLAKMEAIAQALRGHQDIGGEVVSRQEVFTIKVKNKVVYRVLIVTEQQLEGTAIDLGV